MEILKTEAQINIFTYWTTSEHWLWRATHICSMMKPVQRLHLDAHHCGLTCLSSWGYTIGGNLFTSVGMWYASSLCPLSTHPNISQLPLSLLIPSSNEFYSWNFVWKWRWGSFKLVNIEVTNELGLRSGLEVRALYRSVKFLINHFFMDLALYIRSLIQASKNE